MSADQRAAFFDDRHTDVRMRALIPRFARYGSYVTFGTAPFLASGTRLASLLANATVALTVTLLVDRLGLLDRASDVQVQALLVLYAALIANGSGLAGGRAGPFLLMQALPVLFAAVFFAGVDRYVLAVAIGLEHAAVVAAYGDGDAGYTVSAVVLCLLVAHFGVHVADVLREAVAANTALHRVLTVSQLGGDELPRIGLEAAASVVGWDAGAVVLREGDELHIAAAYGVDDGVLESYASDPMTLDGRSLSAYVMRTGEPYAVADVAAFLGADSALARAGLVCMAGVPIPYHEETIGVLVVDNRRPRTPDERELGRLAQIAEQLGLAIGNMRAYRREAQVAAELRELNRRKDAFLATVSHELRTPATTITLAARTLRDADGRLDPADRAYAHDLLVRRSEELTRMIESLLEEALAESDGMRMEFTSLDWSADLERWVDTARAQTGRAIELSLPDVRVTSMGDRAKCERIVANLLSNAAKFSPDGAPIECSLDHDGETVVVAVRDHGPGVPAEARERIFERFAQGDSSSSRAHGGFGIGLSLARRFAEAHGGTVAVADAEGGGSVFTVRLPRAHVPAVRRASERSSEPHRVAARA